MNKGVLLSYKNLNLASFFSHNSATWAANSLVPSPPFAQCVHRLALTPSPSQNSIKAFTSLSVSLIKWFTATATGKPNFLTFSMCLSRLTSPFLSASTFSFFKSSLATPPCIFNALIVATITTQLGLRFDFLHLISRNFSAPKSAPNPASVTT